MTYVSGIEGGLSPKGRETTDLSGEEFVVMLTALSTPQRRAVLAQARVAWPMRTRSQEVRAFLLAFAKWIEAHAET